MPMLPLPAVKEALSVSCRSPDMSMIKKMHRKFILAGTAAVIIIVVGALAVLNATVYMHEVREINWIITSIADNGGTLPDGHQIQRDASWSAVDKLLLDGDDWISSTPDFLYQVRYFSVYWDADQTVSRVDISHTAAFDASSAIVYADMASRLSSDKGFLNKDKAVYAYLRKDYPDGSRLLIVLDSTKNIMSINHMLRYSFWFGLIVIILYVIILAALSSLAVRPFVRNMENQKRFITNAGHELKTPIAIISANAETIEMLNGKSQWTENILKQVRRQSQLINDLIMLAKMGERSRADITLQDMDMSREIQSAVQAFDALAKDQGKTLTSRIKEGIHITADQRCVYEIASILLDNAVKYCDEAGTIAVVLATKKIGKGAVLTVSNDYAAGKDVDYTRFFERFYRGDESHSSAKAGYGIGLSMAEELVQLLKGSINVSYKNGIIAFTVTF